MELLPPEDVMPVMVLLSQSPSELYLPRRARRRLAQCCVLARTTVRRGQYAPTSIVTVVIATQVTDPEYARAQSTYASDSVAKHIKLDIFRILKD